jgi:hypothetical protein
MPSTALSTSRRPAATMLRAAALTVAPAVARGLTSPHAQRGARAVLTMLRRSDPLERLPLLIAANARHPLAPAAVRVERTRAREAEQTAVTVWFQEGPALPWFDAGGAPDRHSRRVWRVGAGLLGLAALAAASTAASRLPAGHPRVREFTDTLTGTAERV